MFVLLSPYCTIGLDYFLREKLNLTNKIKESKIKMESCISHLSILMASVLRSFSSQVSLSSAMIFSVS